MSKSLDFAKLFESALRLSISITSGTLFSPSSAILTLSTSDPYQSKSRDYFKYHNSSFCLTPGSFSISKSRKLRLSLQETDKKEEFFFELWNNSRILSVKDLKKVHTKLASHPTFGKLEWSSDDSLVLYIAEPIEKKSSNFWSGEENAGNLNLFKENFGENLNHLSNPKVFLYNLAENVVSEVRIEDSVDPAQVSFRPNSYEFVYVGYEKFGFKRGIAAMVNRPGKIFKQSIGSDAIEEIRLKEDLMAGLFPKFSPNGKLLAYFGVPKGSLSHSMCMSLVVHSLETGESTVVVPIVHEFNAKFNGIYGYHETLISYNWLSDTQIVFCTPHDASDCVFVVDLNGTVSEIEVPLEKPYSASVLDVFENSVLIKASNPKVPEKAFIAGISDGVWTFEVIENTAQEPTSTDEKVLTEVINESKTVTIEHSSTPLKSVLTYHPNNRNLVVLIHGGPHGTGQVPFKPSTAIRLLSGFNELTVNFRGNTGFGQQILEAALGKIGNFDVLDCIEAISLVKQLTNTEKVVAVGGSHGGFLSLHLACQYDLAASVAMNAVVNIASLCLNHDINDWGFAEVLNSEPVFPPNAQQISELYSASPISKLDNVKCPVLLVVGGSDLRVPPFGSVEAYKVLKALHKEVKMLWYNDDGHGLLSKATTNDFSVNSLKWSYEIVNRQ